MNAYAPVPDVKSAAEIDGFSIQSEHNGNHGTIFFVQDDRRGGYPALLSFANRQTAAYAKTRSCELTDTIDDLMEVQPAFSNRYAVLDEIGYPAKILFKTRGAALQALTEHYAALAALDNLEEQVSEEILEFVA